MDSVGEEGDDVVTPGEFLGEATEFIAGKGAYISPNGRSIRACLTGRRKVTTAPPGSDDNRSTIEIVGHKAHGAVPQPGTIVIARVTKVMARNASADIMCVDSKAVKEKFSGIIGTPSPF
ncbi:Exosome complex component CSL4 [Rhynchospora pubera]|uniref:Exosome complex component CSL4 n=1 Tax=Rhynchospora pubera TaxID=906938 RepID=A0AAV8CCK0_9POAL|nr:Exosome complex component CSL4 [Rhynchospora pubera]